MNEPKKLRFTLKGLTDAGFVEHVPDSFIHKSKLTEDQLKSLKQPKARKRSVNHADRTDPFCQFVKQQTGIELVMEFRFDKKRRWRFDYANEELKLAIEQEGGVFTGGRHTRPLGYKGDMEKYNQASLQGWTLIRRTPDEMLTQETIELIKLKTN